MKIFQNRDRPQGNINKKGKRDFLRSRPRAGQHQQKGTSRFVKVEIEQVDTFQNSRIEFECFT